MKCKGLSTVCASALLAAGLSAPAFAQIDEIIVTATKREESIIDVPIAVSAYGAVQIERAGIRSVQDLPNLSPSFNINSSDTETGGTTLRLRGVGTTGNNTGLESAVGIFIDGVYQSRPGIALQELVNLEAIEVLRGPQGTLFGRNTSAGALVIRTKKADLSEFSAYGNATYGNFDAKNIQAGGSIPLIQDTLAVGFTGAWRDQNGTVESLTGGPDTYDRDRYYLRGEVNWAPTDNFEFRLLADYADADEACCHASIIADPLNGAGAFAGFGLDDSGGVLQFGPENLQSRNTNSNGRADNSNDQWGISGQVNWDLGPVNLTYIGSYRDFESIGIRDSDFVGLDVFQAGEAPDAPGSAGEGYSENQTMTHELRLQGEYSILNWMVGGFYSDEDIEELQVLQLQDDYAAYVAATAAAAGEGAAAVANIVPNAALFPGSFADNLYNQEATSWSIFTHNTLDLTDRLTLTLGARYVRDEKDATGVQTAASSPGCLAVLAALGPAGVAANPTTAGVSCFPFAADVASGAAANFPTDDRGEFTDDELTYVVSLGYDLTDNTNVYFTHSHGYKAGGFNLDPTAAVGGADPRFGAETVDSYELGLKGTFFDNRVSANLAAFHMPIDDFQVLEFTGVQFTTFNVEKAVSTGIEAEFVQSGFFDGLTLTQSITYADSRYPSDCDGDNVSHAQELIDGTANPVSSLCGFALTNAPLWVGVVGATYERDIANNFTSFFNASLRAETRRRTSTQPIDPTNGVDTVDDYQSANGKVNLRAGFGDIDGLWAIEAFATNVFDQQTRNVTFNTPLRAASRGAFLEAPRTFGLTLRTRFN